MIKTVLPELEGLTSVTLAYFPFIKSPTFWLIFTVIGQYNVLSLPYHVTTSIDFGEQYLNSSASSSLFIEIK